MLKMQMNNWNLFKRYKQIKKDKMKRRFIHNKNWTFGDIKLTENKAFEWEFLADNKSGNEFLLSFNDKGDHAGFCFRVKFLNYYVSFTLYDKRHWNWKEDRWYYPGEEQFEKEDE